jgi:hypothetical protein
MNEFQLLERLGDVEPVDHALLDRTVAALMAADAIERREIVMPKATPRRTRRPTRRWAPRVAAVVGAVVITGAVGVIIRPGSAGGPASAAAAELHQLAVVAADQPATAPPAPGQYMYTYSEEAYTSTTVESSGKTYTVSVPETRQIWIGTDGSGRLLESFGQAVFLSAQDRADWVAAGSPSLQQGSSDETFGPGGLSDGPVNLATLPTDPTALAVLFSTGKVEGGPPGPAEEFTQIGDLLRETDASPALRAALYQVAAGLPGVELLGHVTDHSGRSGVGIAYVSGGTQHELIFNPGTSALMGEEDTAVDAPTTASTSKYAAGTLVDWVVYLSSGVVNSTGVGASGAAEPLSSTPDASTAFPAKAAAAQLNNA